MQKTLNATSTFSWNTLYSRWLSLVGSIFSPSAPLVKTPPPAPVSPASAPIKQRVPLTPCTPITLNPSDIPAQLAPLLTLLQHPDRRALTLYGGSTSQRVALLKAAACLPLVQLEVHYLTPAEELILADYPVSLERLTLRYGRLDGVLMEGAMWTGLRQLRIVSVQGTDAVVQEMARCGEALPLEELEIASGKVADHTLKAFLLSNCTPHLERLLLSSNHVPLPLTALSALAVPGRLPALHTLGLSGCGLDTDAVQALTAWDGCGRLDWLDLSHNPIGDDGLSTLLCSGLLQLLIRSGALNLAHAGLTDAGVMSLASSPLLADVIDLSLEGNPLTDVSASCLAYAAAASSLKTVNLSSTAVGDAGVLTLVSRLVGLKTLHIRSSRFSHRGQDAVDALDSAVHIDCASWRPPAPTTTAPAETLTLKAPDLKAAERICRMPMPVQVGGLRLSLDERPIPVMARILSAPHLHALQRLTLRIARAEPLPGWVFTQRLKKVKTLDGLEQLTLAGLTMDATALVFLGKCRFFKGLTCLDLSGCEVDVSALVALRRKAPGLVVLCVSGDGLRQDDFDRLQQAYDDGSAVLQVR